jgi:serine/threonine protein kinase
VESFIQEMRAGKRPSISELTVRHPDLAARIREEFPALILLEELREAGERTGSTFDASLARSGAASLLYRRLGEYRILREIGRGGMGVVFEAEQESLGRRVALKVLPFHSILDERSLERFRREARAAARLQHSHIVPVLGFGEEDGILYYTMQLIRGVGLDQAIPEVARLRSSSGLPNDPGSAVESGSSSRIAQGLLTGRFELEMVPLEPQEKTAAEAVPAVPRHAGGTFEYHRSVARIGVQAARALAYAHSEGVLHRDIKPSNLLLDSTGSVWLTDFGLAKAADLGGVTRPGEVLGTLRYMAPEQLEGEASARSDIYSLGLTLYELAALRPAFGEAERGRMVRAILEEEPERLRRIDPAVSPELEALIFGAIARDPERRPRDAAMLAEGLEAFLQGRPAALSLPLPGKGSSGPRRSRAAGILFLACAGLLGLATYFLWPQGSRPRFSDAVHLADVGSPDGLLALDLDGDGDLDLASVSFGLSRIWVLRNNGERNFSAAMDYPVASRPFSLAAADFDGDGRIDLVTPSVEAPEAFLLPGLGDGAFGPAARFETGIVPVFMAAGDLNGDRLPDLGFASRASRSIAVMLRAGDGRFEPPTRVDLGEEPFCVTIGDLNDDGKPDLVATGSNNDLWVLVQEGEGKFQVSTSHTTAPFPNDLKLADLDGDRLLDAVTANIGAQSLDEPDSVSVFRNLGGGRLGEPKHYLTGDRPFMVAAADLDGDGDLDLATPNERPSTVSILLNRGDGSFEPGGEHTVGTHPRSVQAGDLDGDGDVDLAVANLDSNDVRVLWNIRKSPASLRKP